MPRPPTTASPRSTPAPDLIKVTFYLTPAHHLALERLRLARLERGRKVDKSALVREAIDLLVAQERG